MTYPATTLEEAVVLTTIASNQLHDVINGDEYTQIQVEDGSYIPSVRKAMKDGFTSSGFGGQYKNLSIFIPGTGYQGTITADVLVLEDTNNATTLLRNINLSFDGANSGVNGLDTGVISEGNWYRLFVVYNPTTATTASLISLSETSPTLPSGFTHFTKVGTAYVLAGATNFKRAQKLGNRTDFLQNPANTTSSDNILLSNVTSLVLTEFSCATCAPPEATHLIGISSCATNGFIYITTVDNFYDCHKTLTAAPYAGFEIGNTYPFVIPQTLYFYATTGNFRGVGYLEN